MLKKYLSAVAGEIGDTIREPLNIEGKSIIPQTLALEVQRWARIESVAALFIDMVNSSKIDFKAEPENSAITYEVFTGTLVDTMAMFGADCADVQGDGVLAVFSGNGECVRAFLAGVSFLTACEDHIQPKLYEKSGQTISVQCRAGLSFGPTIVKRIGRRGDWNNRVWAYRTINRTVALCKLASPGKLVADRKAFQLLSECQEAMFSCGCRTNRAQRRRIQGYGESKDLWEELGYERMRHSKVDEAWELQSIWCPDHGDEFFERIIAHFQISLPKIAELNSTNALSS